MADFEQQNKEWIEGVAKALVQDWQVSEPRATEIVATMTISDLNINASFETCARYFAEAAGLERRELEAEDIAFQDDNT